MSKKTNIKERETICIKKDACRSGYSVPPHMSGRSEVTRLNKTAGKALKKGTSEHKKIFETHANAWKALADK